MTSSHNLALWRATIPLPRFGPRKQIKHTGATNSKPQLAWMIAMVQLTRYKCGGDTSGSSAGSKERRIPLIHPNDPLLAHDLASMRRRIAD